MQSEFILLTLVLVQLILFGYASAYCPFFSRDVVRLRGFNIDQWKKVKELMNNYPNLHIKTWVQPLGADTPGLYMAPSDVAGYLVAEATKWGMEATVLMHNVQHSLLDRPDPLNYYQPYKYAYTDPIRNRTHFPRGSALEHFRLDEFHPLGEINNYLELLQRKYPSMCRLESIGKSYNGKDIMMLKIGTNPDSMKGIFLDATMHAREWLATSTALYIASQLLTQFDQNEETRLLVENITWYIVPVVNVDGYEYTWMTDRVWRRSRSIPHGCTGEFCRCRGADLNRNFDSHWNTTDACYHPCCNTFPGVSAMSEPEAQSLSEKLKSLDDKVQSYITLHAYGQYWMYPYGYKKEKYPADAADLHEVAELAVAAVNGVNGVEYKFGSVGDALYEYSGGSQDWVKENTRIKYSYLIELRPPGFDGERAGHFCVNFSQILPTGKEIFEGVKVVAKAVMGQLELTGESWRKLHADTSSAYPWSRSFSRVLVVFLLLIPKIL